MDLDIAKELEAFESGWLGAVLLDENFSILGISAGTLARSGHSPSAVVGRSALDVVHPNDLERAVLALAESVHATDESAVGMYRLKFADDSYRPFAVRATRLGERAGNASIFQFGEVTPQLRAEEFARDTVETLRMLVEFRQLNECLERIYWLTERHMPEAHLRIAAYDKAGVLNTFQPTARGDGFVEDPAATQDLPEHVEGAYREHLRGPWHAFHRMAEFETTATGARVTAVLTDDSDQLLGYIETHRASNETLSDHEWMIHGLIRQVLTIVLQRLDLDEQLRQAAELDPLTGVPNRRRLFSDIAAHGTVEGSALLLIDLDGFSSINNTLGHHIGDQTLMAVAECLTQTCPPGATISRFGGDEFVVWLPPGHHNLADLAAAICAATAAAPDRRKRVRCSIGACTIRANESAEDAIKRADEAMYVAKRRGGDGAHFAE